MRTFKLTQAWNFRALGNVKLRFLPPHADTDARRGAGASVWALRGRRAPWTRICAAHLRLNRLDPWIVMNAADAACSATWRKASWLAPE